MSPDDTPQLPIPITDIQPVDDEMRATMYAYPPGLMPSGEESYDLLSGEEATVIYTVGETGEFVVSDLAIPLHHTQ